MKAAGCLLILLTLLLPAATRAEVRQSTREFHHFFSLNFFAADSDLFYNAGARYDFMNYFKARTVADIGFGWGLNLSYIFHSQRRDRLNATFNEKVNFNIIGAGTNFMSFLPLGQGQRLVFFVGPNLDFVSKNITLAEPREPDEANSDRIVATSSTERAMRFGLATGAFYQAGPFFLGGRLHLVFNTSHDIAYQLEGSNVVQTHKTVNTAFVLGFMGGVAF